MGVMLPVVSNYMGYRYDDLAPGEIYHVYTRGIERRNVFLDRADRERFSDLLVHCLPRNQLRSYSIARRLKIKQEITKDGAGLIDLLSYCLMSNHIHLLIKENFDGGTSLYMHRLLTSYARYFNVRQDRSGSLFVNPFKAVLISGDDQLLHVSRYIHLNPFMARIVGDPLVYRWSSLKEYVEEQPKFLCHYSLIKEMVPPQDYRDFIYDEAGYVRSLVETEHLLIDIDD